MAAGTQRKRHLRWPPVVALVVASAGLFWCVLNPDRSYWIGYALIMVGFFIANPGWIMVVAGARSELQASSGRPMNTPTFFKLRY
jgi:hypothetical protein